MAKWNILKLVQEHGNPNAYRDFEGLADGNEVLAVCKDDGGRFIWNDLTQSDDGKDRTELTQAVRDIGLNLLYERVDEGDEVLTYEDAWTTFHTVHELLTVGNWTKSGLTDDNRIEPE